MEINAVQPVESVQPVKEPLPVPATPLPAASAEETNVTEDFSFLQEYGIGRQVDILA